MGEETKMGAERMKGKRAWWGWEKLLNWGIKAKEARAGDLNKKQTIYTTPEVSGQRKDTSLSFLMCCDKTFSQKWHFFVPPTVPWIGFLKDECFICFGFFFFENTHMGQKKCQNKKK